MPVILVGTLDTKGTELAFVRDRLHAARVATLVIDAGSVGPPAFVPDIDRERVFFRAGADLDQIRQKGDRGEAVNAASIGVASLVAELHDQGKVDGILAIGGSAGTTIGTAAMRALPVGIPKVMVSTLASGQTRPFVGGSDIAMFHSVADIAGLNRLTRTILSNAAHAMAGMVKAREQPRHPRDMLSTWEITWYERHGLDVTQFDDIDDPEVRYIEDEPQPDRPVIAATMFGVTTPCVDHARRLLESLGFEVWVFHATGVGGQAMEGLIRDGQVQGVLDLTTTELADERVGGVLSAGPDRLEAAGRAGIPQVVSLGALDMVNFGPMATVPERFRGRKLHVHNANVTLMRTTPEENAELGGWIASKLRDSLAPTAVLIPRGGVSAIDAPGKPFWDPDADTALFDALKAGIQGFQATPDRTPARSASEGIPPPPDPSPARSASEGIPPPPQPSIFHGGWHVQNPVGQGNIPSLALRAGDGSGEGGSKLTLRAGFRLIDRPENINDPAFAEAAALTLAALMRQSGRVPPDHDGLSPRWAGPDDLPGIVDLLQESALPIDDLAQRLDAFLVIRSPDGRILGVAGLEHHGPVGFLRSVAVRPELRGFGLGASLVANLLNQAFADGLDQVVLQTHTAGDFFARTFHFQPIAREEVDAALNDSASWKHGGCKTALVMQRKMHPTEESPT